MGTFWGLARAWRNDQCDGAACWQYESTTDRFYMFDEVRDWCDFDFPTEGVYGNGYLVWGIGVYNTTDPGNPLIIYADAGTHGSLVGWGDGGNHHTGLPSLPNTQTDEQQSTASVMPAVAYDPISNRFAAIGYSNDIFQPNGFTGYRATNFWYCEADDPSEWSAAQWVSTVPGDEPADKSYDAIALSFYDNTMIACTRYEGFDPEEQIGWGYRALFLQRAGVGGPEEDQFYPKWKCIGYPLGPFAASNQVSDWGPVQHVVDKGDGRPGYVTHIIDGDGLAHWATAPLNIDSWEDWTIEWDVSIFPQGQQGNWWPGITTTIRSDDRQVVFITPPPNEQGPSAIYLEHPKGLHYTDQKFLVTNDSAQTDSTDPQFSGTEYISSSGPYFPGPTDNLWIYDADTWNLDTQSPASAYDLGERYRYEPSYQHYWPDSAGAIIALDSPLIARDSFTLSRHAQRDDGLDTGNYRQVGSRNSPTSTQLSNRRGTTNTYW